MTQQIMGPKEQEQLEHSIPLLAENLKCMYCSEAGKSFSWKDCYHYGGNQKKTWPKGSMRENPLDKICTSKSDWDEWIEKLKHNHASKKGDTEYYRTVLSQYLEDTLQSQIDHVWQSLQSERPVLMISLSRHPYPLDKSGKNKTLKPGIQAFPYWHEPGAYDQLFNHSLQLLNRLKSALRSIKNLQVVLYMGSNAVSQFAFNDALQFWFDKNDDAKWKTWNMFFDTEYSLNGEIKRNYHLRPNSSQYSE